jgi:perosamine synthetase
MKCEKLALLGGPKTITKSFKRYNSIGVEEIKAVQAVMESGILSQFLGEWDADFYGGPKVQEFERMCEKYFGVKHAITVNSWTSGLIAAVGAVGIEPGDEVIVTPWTMCASATSILHWNAIPVFADIEPNTFCLDPDSVEANITPFTKAIMAVDILGHSANMNALNSIAKKYGLKVISDSAQAPGSYYQGQLVGTISDVGGYSLNYHKHIHTGEGGILVTNNDLIADRLRLIRNHAEAVVGPKGEHNLTNMIGHNFRLGEIECAIGIEQLKKLNLLVAGRQRVAEKLTKGLEGLIGLRTPQVDNNCTHSYYMYPMVLDLDVINVSRSVLVKALQAEGIVGIAEGYANIHMLPMYQKKIAYGAKGFPWSADFCHRDVDYSHGICPVAEELHEKTYMAFPMCLHELSEFEIDLIIAAFHKVWAQLALLKNE